VLHPNGLRPLRVNWDEAAGDLIRHLHDQIATSPWDEGAQGLRAEVLAHPGVPARWGTRQIGAPTTPLLAPEHEDKRSQIPRIAR